jgi:hypothetical protein
LKENLKEKAYICCRHFVPHSHSHKRGGKSPSIALLPVPASDLSSQLEVLSPPLKKRKKRWTKRFKQLKEEMELLKDYKSGGARVTRRHQDISNLHSSILGIDTSHPSVTIFDIQDALKNISQPSSLISDNSVNQGELISIVSIIIQKAVLQQQLTYDAFNFGREDLFVWTGFHSLSSIQNLYLEPLFAYYLDLAKDDRRNLPASQVPVRDRVLWLLMFMWTDMSFTTLYEHLKRSHSIPQLSLIGFKKILKKTAQHLSSSLEKSISFPSIDEWKERNTGPGMNLYNERKLLLLILDGSSIMIKHPSSSHHSSGREWWVTYKKHHAWRFFVAVNSNGHINYVSPCYSGSESDSVIYNASGLKMILEELYTTPEDGWKLLIGGDKGYVFVVPPEGFSFSLLIFS